MVDAPCPQCGEQSPILTPALARCVTHRCDVLTFRTDRPED